MSHENGASCYEKRRTHRSNRLSDYMPLCRPCNLSSSIVQSARKEKSRGVFKEHELYSNSYGLKGRPHQLHPLLGCHPPFNWVSFFTHRSPLPSPVPFTFVEPEGWCLKVVWSQKKKTENSVAEKNWNRVFFSFNFHLHLFDTISEKNWLSIWASVHSPLPWLNINPHLLSVDCFWVRGGVGA